MERRTFLKTNMLAIPAIAIPAGAKNKQMEILQAELSVNKPAIKFFCPRWGATDTWDSFCKRVKEAGYDGVETPLSGIDAPERDEVGAALNKYNLILVGQYYQTFEPDGKSMAANLYKHLHTLAPLKPVRIDSQTGKDFFSFEDNKLQIDAAAKFTKETGIEVVHETHRGKALFTAPATKTYLEAFPDMRITLDISHWCNVHESLLGNQKTTVDFNLSRANHIHARIGHPEGPQVADPRAPEWNEAVQAHLAWWDEIVKRHAKAGTQLTITPEFGPPSYMPTLPYTNQPVSSQWDINVHMMQLLKKRYGLIG